jgi:outer membrane protein OmpA-like peptidoglycan-associated protein
MQKISRLAVLLVLGTLASINAFGQLRDQGFGAGVGAGATLGMTDVTNDDFRFLARGFLRFPLVKSIQGEIGFGVGQIGGSDYRTQIIPIEFRFVFSPFAFESFNPYLYAGMGGLSYLVKELPPKPTVPRGTGGDSWTGVVPAGIGVQVKLSDGVLFEVSAGYNYALGAYMGKNLNAITETKNDAYLSGVAGITLVAESPNADPDLDGLTNAEEKQLGTNKKVADTDGDGLNDGDEVRKYKTDPLKVDSDNDGLKDGDEVRLEKTDPNKADTDGDGLTDGDELTKYKTDPLKADTDGDGLKDGEEVTKYKTDPLKADTDGDGLKDGEEVTKYKTDPLKADTDGGTVNDMTEITRGSNPLDPADDVPKVVVPVVVGKSMVMEGVAFETGKALINPSSAGALEKAYQVLSENPEVTVEIQGYTDNAGKKAANMKLSQARAEAVRVWLITKGIAANRVDAKGYGPENPVAPNATKEGKAKNRRIEFFRTK